MTDEALDTLIHRADLDGLVRLVDDVTAAGDWARLRRLRDAARHALGTGRQLWPAATLAEYRLALWLRPSGPPACSTSRRAASRIGPLTEVVAQHHTWAELAPLLEPGPRAAVVAHERVLRGESIEASTVAELPNTLDLPYQLAPWEPRYVLADYRADGAEFAAPDLPTGLVELVLPTDVNGALLDDDLVELAVRQLVEPWTTSSDGRAEVVAVEGDAATARAGARHHDCPCRRARSGRCIGVAGVGRRQRRRLRAAPWCCSGTFRCALAGRRVRRRPRRLAARSISVTSSRDCVGGGGTPTSPSPAGSSNSRWKIRPKVWPGRSAPATRPDERAQRSLTHRCRRRAARCGHASSSPERSLASGSGRPP